MNISLLSDIENIWFIAGWTMIHFLWLGALVGLAALASRWLTRRATASVRYAVAISWLFVLAAMPVAIAVWLVGDSALLKRNETKVTVASAEIPPAVAASNVVVAQPTSEVIELNTPAAQRRLAPAKVVDAPALVAKAEPNRNSPLFESSIPYLGWIELCIPHLPWLWLIGTPITFALTATGLIGTRRLRRASRPIIEGPIADALRRLVASLQITREVTVAVCDRIAAPVLIGILRPIILLPPAALTGYSPEEIEMVLLHELAHVRRSDNLVNLIQRLVESVLFFHPAIWLTSSWVRREREACCDALVVTRIDRPHAYAELLVALAAQMPRSVLFHPAASSAMAAGPLRSRIRNILKLDDDPMLVSGESFLLTIAGLVTAAALVALYVPAIGHADQPAAEAEASLTNDKVTTVADALDEFRKAIVTYNLDFDSVFPQREWTAYDPGRLARYSTRDAWPNVLGHIDNNAGSFRSVRSKPSLPHENVTGGNAYFVPLTWNIGTQNYATLLFLKGIEKDAHVVANSYTSFACFGPLSGDVLFGSYATAVVRGDVSGQITANSYFDLIVTGKLAGRVTTQTYAMIYIMGGFTGKLELDQSKAYIAGNTSKADLKRITGRGKLYLEESDLPQGEQNIGQFVVTVKKSTTKTTANSEDEKMQAERDSTPEPVLIPFKFVLKQDASGKTQLYMNDQPVAEDVVRVVMVRQGKFVSKLDVTLSTHEGVSDAEVKKVIDLLRSLGIKKLALDKRTDAEEAGEAETVEQGPSTKKTSSKFPALEDQKLADLAWKLLGMELEVVDKEDIKRVQALGYDGGLEVVSGAAGFPGNGSGVTIQPGDILVGLHSWPTTTMKELVNILNREDVAELNPLKFYIVRNEQTGPPTAGNPKEATFHDVVRTGRLNVNFGQFGGMRSKRSQSSSQGTQSKSAMLPQTSSVSKSLDPNVVASSTNQESAPSGKPAEDIAIHRAPAAELEILNERVKIAEEQFKLNDDQLKKGTKGGSKERREIAAYELALAQANLATAEGKRDEALAKMADAQSRAEEAYKAVVSAYDVGHVSYDFLRYEANRVAEIKLKVARLKNETSRTQASPQSSDVRPDAPAGKASNVELDILRERVKSAQDQFTSIDAAYKKGTRGGTIDRLEIAAYELSLAQSALATAEGNHDEAAAKLKDALGHAESAYKAVAAAYEAGRVSYDLLRQESNKLSEIKLKIAHLQQASSTSANGNKKSPVEYTVTTSAARPFSAKPDALRYDGKSFDEWCAIWQTDLSVDRRTDAVKAIAAFGANGYGPEAAATLMELAGQYDWTSIGHNLAVEPLLKACVNAFGGRMPSANNVSAVAQSIPVKDVLAEFSADVKSGNANQKLFLTYVLRDIHYPQAVDLQLALSKEDDPRLRRYALGGLPMYSDSPAEEKVATRIRESLGSKNVGEVLVGLTRLDRASAAPSITLPTEFFPTLFSPDERVRKLARKVAGTAKDDEKKRIAGELLAVLSDESRKDDHIEAIRALGVLKQAGSPAIEKLEALAKSDDKALSIAAVQSLRGVLSVDDYNKMLVDIFGERLGIRLLNGGKNLLMPSDPKQAEEYQAFDRALAQERKQLFP